MSPMEQDPDTGAIALCAIRYAIGRRTYMPSLVVDWCKNHWMQLPAKDRSNIQRDVQETIDRADNGFNELGDDCDAKMWRSFSAWMKQQNVSNNQSKEVVQ